MNDDINQDQEIISNGLVLPDQQQPDKLYIIPVHNRPFSRLRCCRSSSMKILGRDPGARGQDAAPAGGVVLRRLAGAGHGHLRPGQPAGTWHHGPRTPRLAGGWQAAVRRPGPARVRIRGWLRRKPPYLVEVDYPKSDEDPRDEVKAYGMALINAIKELLPLNPLYSEELKTTSIASAPTTRRR